MSRSLVQTNKLLRVCGILWILFVLRMLLNRRIINDFALIAADIKTD